MFGALETDRGKELGKPAHRSVISGLESEAGEYQPEGHPQLLSKVSFLKTLNCVNTDALEAGAVISHLMWLGPCLFFLREEKERLPLKKKKSPPPYPPHLSQDWSGNRDHIPSYLEAKASSRPA